jgi:hypothetical protein
MNNVILYSIYDTATQAFMQPFYMHNDASATRAFSDNVNSNESTISKHPDHYKLYKVGEWDDQKGQLTALPSPTFVIGAIDCINPTKEDDILKEIKSLKGYLSVKPELDAITN